MPFYDFAVSTMVVRTGVIKSVEVAIQPVLRNSPPSPGYFFKNLVTQVSTSLHFAMMSSLSASSLSTHAKGKGYGRNSRGRGGGWK